MDTGSTRRRRMHKQRDSTMDKDTVRGQPSPLLSLSTYFARLLARSLESGARTAAGRSSTISISLNDLTSYRSSRQRSQISPTVQLASAHTVCLPFPNDPTGGVRVGPRDTYDEDVDSAVTKSASVTLTLCINVREERSSRFCNRMNEPEASNGRK